jgi:hypothetical protein
MVHIFAWRGLPDKLEICLAWANDDDRDDNLSIAIASDRDDIFSVMMTSRCEPFEGVSETINFQHAKTICKIDDFRRMTIWQGSRRRRRRYWPKDVGHERAILQPFRPESGRDWHEIELSTLLILHIAEMVRNGVRTSSFSFSQSWSRVLVEMENHGSVVTARPEP